MNGFAPQKRIYTGNNTQYPENDLPEPKAFPPPPSWRKYQDHPEKDDYPVKRADYRPFKTYGGMVDAVNMAIYLRRPLLVTGDPGVGKTSLAYDIAYELQLGEVLEWPITSRTSLNDGLYHYDAIGRLHAAALAQNRSGATGKRSAANIPDPVAEIGDFITLGPLGTALVPRSRPRLLLIDEFDKSDYDLPNDLLYILETGEFEIQELKRVKKQHPNIEVRLHNSDERYKVNNGKLACSEFPLIVITSNEERELPIPFKRRCIRLSIERPQAEQLSEIVQKHITGMTEADRKQMSDLIDHFIKQRDNGEKVANDQLMNAVYLMSHYADVGVDYDYLRANILRSLDQ